MVVVSIDGGDLPDLQTSDRFDSRVRDMSGSQSAIERRLQDGARRLFSGSNTRRCCQRRFSSVDPRN